MARRKTPMTRAELAEKISYLTSAFGADAYADGYKNGVLAACETVQNWGVDYPLSPGLMVDLIKKLGELRKRGRGR